MKIIILATLLFHSLNSHAWQEILRKDIAKIDNNFPGQLGVVIKDLKTGKTLEYNADKKWYLSSTIKVLVAISLMEEVEEGDIKLDQKVTLRQEHFVDGGGPLLWREAGEQFTVKHLLKLMLRNSDNTAADILIGLIGVNELNQDIKKWIPSAGPITSLLKVRYLSFGELHPKAKNLNNMDFVVLKNTPLEKRHIAFSEKINVSIDELHQKSLEDAQEKFYEQGYNSAKLQDYVQTLENLLKGELLSEKNTNTILEHMEHMTTGEGRIKAGLDSKITFFQKTGTQIHRACNMGLIEKSSSKTSSLAIAVCIEKNSEDIDSDSTFKQIGQVISERDNLLFK